MTWDPSTTCAQPVWFVVGCRSRRFSQVPPPAIEAPEQQVSREQPQRRFAARSVLPQSSIPRMMASRSRSERSTPVAPSGTSQSKGGW